jgi:hypothetical protein
MGTPAKAAGILTDSGLSVLFLMMIVPPVESLGINTASTSPESIPMNRSTDLAGGSFFDVLAGLAAKTTAGMATARAASHHFCENESFIRSLFDCYKCPASCPTPARHARAVD